MKSTLSLLGVAFLVVGTIRPAVAQLGCPCSIKTRDSLQRDKRAAPVAEPAETQEQAIRLAKSEDSPSLKRADSARIKRIRGQLANVLVAGPGELKRLREALAVRAVPSSCGEQLYKVVFYQGDKVVRGVWVYDSGEWGFTRRRGPHWTLGSNASPPNLLDELIEKHEDDVPKRRVIEYAPDWGIKVCLESGGKRLVAYDGEGKEIWQADVPGKPATAIWIESARVTTVPEKWAFEVTSGNSLGRPKPDSREP
jgi:hypothetical protein